MKCYYCNKDTSEVDNDYLVGEDHLQCVLKQSLRERNMLTVPFDLITETPNDQELGEKIRLLYHEAKNLR